QYFLKAIENGHVGALKSLAIYYWEKNKKKDVSWTFIVSYIQHTKKETIQDRLIILLISAWAKKTFFQENRFKVLNEFIKNQPQLIPLYLIILYHDYSDFLINEFEEGSLSDQLKTNHHLEYLVTL